MSKFKVGDKVRRINGGSFLGMHEGDIGTISYIYKKWINLYEYKSESETGTYDLDYFELVEDIPTTTYSKGLTVNSDNISTIMSQWLDNTSNTTWKMYIDEAIGSSGSINNNKKTNIMSKITSYVKNLTLTSDEKLLRKYGLHDDCGNNTSEAENAIDEKNYNSKENQDYLITIAKGLEEEANKNK